ncbi:unnamed protein product, partial [Ectocarpus fasciculatus]
MPLSFVPLAPAPPLLSGATNTVQPKTSSGGIDTVSSTSSEALNGGRDSRHAQAAAMAAVAAPPSAQSSNGVSKGGDLAGPKGGGRDTPSPTLALARAGLRSVPKEHRREPRAVAAAAAEKAISMVGKSVESGTSVEADSSSGSGVPSDRDDQRGGRSSPDSFYSDGSGDSSRESGSTTRRTHTKVLELEERRAALVAASLRTSAVPPPPPPRLLSQSSRDVNGFLRGEVTRPKPTKLLARSKTTVVEATTSSSSLKLAGGSVAAAFFTNRPKGSGEDGPCEVNPLRPEMRARQPRKPQQQQQQQKKKPGQQTGGEGSTAPTSTTATATTATQQQQQQQEKLVVKFPMPSSSKPKPRGGAAPREYSPPPLGVKPSSPFGGAGAAATGGSVRSLVPGPRLVLAGASFDADPMVSTAAVPPVGGGGGGERRHGGGMLLVSRGSMDDLPPAEMGALGVSLVCTMCGRKEKKREAGGVKEANGGVGLGDGGRKGSSKEVEMARCARCRKGCCQACLKHLPAHCRGPKIVIPVCGTCARGVDFENRWHHHLLATTRDRARCNGVSHLPAAAAGEREQGGGGGGGGGGRSRSVSPRADSACGSSPGQSPQRRSQAGADGKRGAGLRGGGGRPEQRALASTSSSLLRASSRLIRRSLSSSSMLGGAPPAETAPVAVDDSGLGAQQQPQLPPAGSRVFKVLSLPIARGGGGGGNNGRPHSIPRCSSSSHREESEEEDSAAEATAAAAPPIAAASAMAWFGSSIGSALSSLASSGGVGNGSTLASAFAPKDRGGGGSGGGGGGATPPSARLTPASPASASSAPEQDLEPPQAILPGSSSTSAATKPWATAGAPMALSVVAAAAAAAAADGSSGKVRSTLPPGAGGRASPLDNGRFGRDPTECPCGAAALYREVIEVSGKGMAVAMVTAGGEAVGPEEAAAELEAKALAAHKLVRAKAYAHLLTRAMKALAYADLQAKAFEFLRERGAAAKSEQAGPSRKDRYRSLPEAFLSVRDDRSSRVPAATTAPASTATAAAVTRDDCGSNDVRSLAVAAGDDTHKTSSAGGG